METIAVWSFRWVPPFAQGLVRDLRVRWALEEAGLAYESRLIALSERSSAAYRQKHPFGLIPALESAGRPLIESGAIVLQPRSRTRTASSASAAARPRGANS